MVQLLDNIIARLAVLDELIDAVGNVHVITLAEAELA